jgi:hypothetical protein
MKKTLLVLIFSFAFAGFISAQPVDPDTDPDLAVPITGLEWLLAGGCALGLRKIFRAKMSKEED